METSFEEYIDRHNNQGDEDFDGLSPKQMYNLLYSDYATSLVKLNPQNNSIDEIPLIKQIRYFINQIDCEQEIKLTKVGNLPPRIIKELYEQRIISDYEIEQGITKLTKETDCKSIELTRILCELSGLIKKRNNVLSLTQKTMKVLNSNELFPMMFSTFGMKFDWSYFDRYTNKQIGQLGINYSLYLLNKYGDSEHDADYYAKKYFKAFPDLKMGKTEFGSDTSNEHCYSVRTFERFLEYFGFLQIHGNRYTGFKILKSKSFNKYIEI